jgi:soluble lytic murein transglycosylase-like protein
MRFCLSWAGIGLAGCGLLYSANSPERRHRASSVVRADTHSGRLVRTLVVSPRAVPGKVVQARPVLPVEPSAAPAAKNSSVEQLIDEAARRYQVDPLLVHSVIQVESNYNPFAISYKGARGVMQLMPSTARRFEVNNSFNPWQNIDGGVRYLKYLLDLFDSPRLAVAAYNAGEGSVFRYGNIPPYPETHQYVRRVATKYGALEAARKSKPVPPKVVKPPEHPPIQQTVDAQGRVLYYNQTRSAP